MKKTIAVILSLFFIFSLVGCGGKNELDYKNTDNKSLKWAADIVKDVCKSKIDSCYKAKKDEYPEPNADEGKYVKDFYKFILRDKSKVIVGIEPNNMYFVIKTEDMEDFHHVTVDVNGYKISNELYP